jgi:uncharacterized membrane protein
MENKNSITKRIIINAEISKVYSVWIDIEKWNLWTKSINKISILENNTFEIGGKARVVQPKLFPSVWTITDVKTNESFVWDTKTLGVTIVAKHILESTRQGTIAETTIIYEGFLASLFYRLSSNLTTQYLTMEINGLKNECESIEESNNKPIKP